VYSPRLAGSYSVEDIKQNLVEKGMSPSVAEHLKQEYLAKLAGMKVYSLMDLFSNKGEALGAVQKAKYDEIYLNFERQGS